MARDIDQPENRNILYKGKDGHDYQNYVNLKAANEEHFNQMYPLNFNILKKIKPWKDTNHVEVRDNIENRITELIR